MVFERAKFNQRRQQHGETADQFIASLHVLAAKCEYGTLRDSLIRDRILVGIRDSELSKRLQMDEKLTLVTCCAKVQQSEMISGQQSTVRQDEPKKVCKVTKKPDAKKKHSGKKKTQARGNSSNCKNCGHESHHGDPPKCPGSSANCNICSRVGHYARCCKLSEAKKVKQLTTEQTTLFLWKITKVSGCCERWTSRILVGKEEIPQEFEADSGSDLTCIRYEDYRKSFGKMKRCDPRVEGPDGRQLEVIGVVELQFAA